MNERVVITGLGVVSPNGISISEFKENIINGVSGVRLIPELVNLKFECQIAGVPQLPANYELNYFTQLELSKFKANGVLYGVIAGTDAWRDAGLMSGNVSSEPDWDSGMIFGIGTVSLQKMHDSMHLIDKSEVKKLGSNSIVQTMPSSVSAYLTGKLSLGNQATVISSACATGTESILMAFERIKSGKAKRMLAGGLTESGPYTWGGFDAMRVTTYKHNHEPEKGSQPMGKNASGFVPGSGAGALVLESLTSALERGAHIYAEVLGGNVNSGGQKGDGSMTLPNSIGAQKCIQDAISDAGILANEVDVINGHLTSTSKCSLEIQNWSSALNRKGKNFPYITALKSMIGHTLGAAGAIESIAAVLQLEDGFLIPNLNCEEIDPEILKIVDAEKITQTYTKKDINIIAKSSFGFGDVNACVIFKKYSKD